MLLALVTKSTIRVMGNMLSNKEDLPNKQFSNRFLHVLIILFPISILTSARVRTRLVATCWMKEVVIKKKNTNIDLVGYYLIG